MDVEDAIRGRRTHKAFGPEPVPRAVVEELLLLARWAPNHHLTQPWRFRVVGPETLRRLQELGGPTEAVKLARAPTLVVASCLLSGDPVRDEEDLHAAACAVYAVLLGAHARGLASYWRTPSILLTPAGRDAVALEPAERLVGLIHLGARVTDPAPRERADVGSYTTFLD